MPETFAEWKKAIGMPYLEPAGIDFFDSGPLMLEAAPQGIGVAFMHGHHFDALSCAALRNVWREPGPSGVVARDCNLVSRVVTADAMERTGRESGGEGGGRSW